MKTREEKIEYLKQYYQDNKEEIKARTKQWEIDHRKKAREANKRWRAKNREKINAQNRERNKTEEAKAYKQAYNPIRNKKRRDTAKKQKEFVRRYKLLCGCKTCGYKKFAGALDFHHEGDDKEKSVAKVLGKWSFKRIKDEIRKCVVLCANCHRELHG